MVTNKNIVVMKFGGAALENEKNIINAAHITKDFAKTSQPIIVVSALKGITDHLYNLSLLCQEGNRVDALKKIATIHESNKKILLRLGNDIVTFETQQQIQLLIDLLKVFIQKNLGKKLSLAQIDYIVSFGERISVYIFTFALRQLQEKVVAIDSAHLINTTGEFGKAKILPKQNTLTLKKLLLGTLKNNAIPVVTGFIGHRKDGCVTTLGRGGSDYSATSIASLLKAEKIILWKDIMGMYDKDPKEYTNARYFKKINYKDAIRMSTHGAKVLHPESVIPAKEKDIPIFIKCFLQPHFEGTMIWKGRTLYA